MRRKLLVALALLLLLATGCWDKLEVEDQLFPVTVGIDKGEHSRYKLAVRVPISAQMRSGVLGGRTGGGRTTDILGVEADTIAQAMYILNASVARRMTLRHLRGIAIGEALAWDGMQDLLAELTRNGEIHETAAFYVARGSATEMLATSRPTGEFNPGKINEGLLLVEKGLHMAPPIRLHHMLARRIAVGVDPFAPIVGSNRRISGDETGRRATESAIAGDLDRTGRNPMEIAGTAICRDTKLAGFLNVDETQALLAMRGEMGKAYMTLPDPLKPGSMMIIRFQQENKPQVRVSFSPNGPRVTSRLLFEGEVLSGQANYQDPVQLAKVEDAAEKLMSDTIQAVVAKLKEWRADPVGYGLYFRGKFPTWEAWHRYHWRGQLAKLDVQVTTQMRIRRTGLIHNGPVPPEED